MTATAHQKPPLAHAAPENMRVHAKAGYGDIHDVSAKGHASAQRQEEIVVREEDFHRFGCDLKKLRECRVPKLPAAKQELPVKRLSQVEVFEQACREQSEVLDPWHGIENPEATRAFCEKDFTLNQVWGRSASMEISEGDSPQQSRRQSLNSSRAKKLDPEAEERKKELLEWLQKVGKPTNRLDTLTASTRSGSAASGSRCTSASRSRASSIISATSSKVNPALSGAGPPKPPATRTEILKATPRGGGVRRHSREQPLGEPQLYADYPPRPPPPRGDATPEPASASEDGAPNSARRSSSGSRRPSVASSLPPIRTLRAAPEIPLAQCPLVLAAPNVPLVREAPLPPERARIQTQLPFR